MGVYLSEPNKQKITVLGEGKNLKYVAAGMQGYFFFQKNKNKYFLNKK